jgi:hypothetical protein
MMQSKKNNRLLVSFVSMVLLIVSFYFFGHSGSQMKVDASLFKPKEDVKIDHISLQSSTDKVDLDLDGVRWTVNHQYEADRQLVKLLFATLQKAEPKRPVSPTILDSTNMLLSKKGVTVSLYEGDNLVQSFRAGGNIQKTEAYFQKSDGQLPYVMSIPGYRLYVSYIFELDEDAWRERRIFNFNWRNFKSLKMILSNDPSQNFEVSFKDQFFSISGMASVDTTKLNNYLNAVSLLSADQFIKAGVSDRYDRLLKTEPSFRIEVKDIADQVYSLDIFSPEKDDPTVVGKLEEDQLVVFGRNNILPIAKKRNFFIAR